MSKTILITLFDRFVREFEPLYGKDDVRWQGLKFIAKELLSLNRPVKIIETGSMRKPGAWRSDGNATAVWDWIACETNGLAISIDIDIAATQTTKFMCSNVQAVTADSITALRGILPEKIDLLFLDSYDYSAGEAINAVMHQVAELGAAWSKLPEGCLIASDDCESANSGKHILTTRVLGSLGMQPIHDGYVSVWRKKSPEVK